MRKAVILCGLIASVSASAGDFGVEKIGDYFQVMVPTYALGLAMKESTDEGAKQLAYSFLSTQISVIGLKTAIDEERPDKSDSNSFPSGHTASAFSGATFIHKRYGVTQAIVPYIMAGFTGYSRVEAEKHHWHDVVAGAAIASFYTWVFVDKENQVSISANTKGGSVKYETSF